MLSFKRFLLSRKTILAFIILILVSAVIAYIFPQRFSTSPQEMEKWLQFHPAWAPWVSVLGLDHCYSTPWFAALLFAFLFALTISAYEQVKISLKKTFGHASAAGEKRIELPIPEETAASYVKKQGYFRVASDNRESRFVKHPWGYWGNALLHLGMVIVITSSLLIVLTQKRGLLQLVEGEMAIPGGKWLVEDNGILAGRFLLPEATSIENVVPEFWETDDIKQLTTTLNFIDPVGRFSLHTLAINRTLNYKGLRIYQSQDFGDAFFVELSDRTGEKYGEILQLENPSRRDTASYGNFQVEGIPYLLKAKYFADAEKRSMVSSNPLLVLRLTDGQKVVGEVPLKMGQSGRLGPYTAKLVDVKRWAGIIFVEITGMPGIFLGFFIIIAGGGLQYFTPPREFYLRKENGRIALIWKASRFENFYKDEFEGIAAEFGERKIS